MIACPPVPSLNDEPTTCCFSRLIDAGILLCSFTFVSPHAACDPLFEQHSLRYVGSHEWALDPTTEWVTCRVLIFNWTWYQRRRCHRPRPVMQTAVIWTNRSRTQPQQHCTIAQFG